MSHFSVLVVGDDPQDVLEPFREGNVDDAPQEFLMFRAYDKDGNELGEFESEEQATRELGENEPFDPENSYWVNTQARWDWCEVGGRWENALLLTSGEWVNQAHKRDIDFHGMYQTAAKAAAETYQRAKAIMAGKKLPRWKEFAQSYGEDTLSARTDYNKLDLVVALKKADLYNPEEFLVPEAEYTKQAGEDAISQYVFLSGENWIESGSMGWFGVSTPNEHTETWGETFLKLLSSVEEDELITIFDCHI